MATNKTKDRFCLERLSRHRFEKEKFDKIILVTGATENHAYHLPMGTDTLAAYGVGLEVARKTPGALLLPPIPFGVSDNLVPYPFTITLTAETLSQVIFEAVGSCVVGGFEHFFFINGHGGNNSAIDVAVRKVRRTFPKVKVAASMAWWISGPKLCPGGTFGPDFGIGHAGEAETSVALHLAPGLVDMDVAKGEWPKTPREIHLFSTIPQISETGATGDPANATAEKGRLVVEHLSDHISRFLIRMDETGWEFAQKDWDF